MLFQFKMISGSTKLSCEILICLIISFWGAGCSSTMHSNRPNVSKNTFQEDFISTAYLSTSKPENFDPIINRAWRMKSQIDIPFSESGFQAIPQEKTIRIFQSTHQENGQVNNPKTINSARQNISVYMIGVRKKVNKQYSIKGAPPTGIYINKPIFIAALLIGIATH